MSFIMRNRRVNVYKNTNLNQVVTDYRAGTPLKNVNTQEAYKNITPNVIPGGIPKKGAKVPLAWNTYFTSESSSYWWLSQNISYGY